jgi:hypothetical protein
MEAKLTVLGETSHIFISPSKTQENEWNGQALSLPFYIGQIIKCLAKGLHLSSQATRDGPRKTMQRSTEFKNPPEREICPKYWHLGIQLKYH